MLRETDTGRFTEYDDYSERLLAFQEYLTAIRSKATVRTYVHCCRYFENFLDEKEIEIEKAHSGLLDDFIVWLSHNGLTPNSIYTHVNSVKSYLRWLKGRTTVPEFNKPNLPRIIKRKGYTPSEVEVVKYQYAARVVRQPIRTVLLLLPYCGMRIGEICKLPLNVVELKNDNKRNPYFVFKFINKGQEEVQIPILPPGDVYFEDYLLNWRKQNKPYDWLFPGREGSHITPDAVRYNLDDVRKIIGSNSITPHSLRRYYATNLYKMKVDPVTIAKLMGHVDIKTTYKHYINPTIEETLDKITDIRGKYADRN